jgi:hypothetical protein
LDALFPLKFVDRDKRLNAEAMNVQITLAENLEPLA